MSILSDFVEERKAKLKSDQEKMRNSMVNSGGFTSPNALTFVADARTRLIVLDELALFAAFEEENSPTADAEEPVKRGPGRPRKA